MIVDDDDSVCAGCGVAANVCVSSGVADSVCVSVAVGVVLGAFVVSVVENAL